MKTMICGAALAAIAVATAVPAAANNVGENGAWQFRSAADLANLATVLDVIEKRQSGTYAAPTYTTNIARQNNCGVSASAAGNSGAQTALANSPTVTGANAGAEGNVSDTALNGAGSNRQGNSGAVSAGVSGGTSAEIRGSASQALNSTQTNSGTQTASVTGSTACTFAALN